MLTLFIYLFICTMMFSGKPVPFRAAMLRCHSHIVKSSQVHEDIGVHLRHFHGVAGGVAVLWVLPSLQLDVVEVAVLLDHIDTGFVDVINRDFNGTAEVLGPLQAHYTCTGTVSRSQSNTDHPEFR